MCSGIGWIDRFLGRCTVLNKNDKRNFGNIKSDKSCWERRFSNRSLENLSSCISFNGRCSVNVGFDQSSQKTFKDYFFLANTIGIYRLLDRCLHMNHLRHPFLPRFLHQHVFQTWAAKPIDIRFLVDQNENANLNISFVIRKSILFLD